MVQAKSILKILCYPILVASGLTTIYLGVVKGWDKASLNIAFLLYVIISLAFWERLIPHKIQWQITRAEAWRDFIYLLVTMVAGGMAAFLAYFVATKLSFGQSDWPFLLEILLALLLSSFASYTFHRITHVQPWLWMIHGVHHVEAKVNVGNNGVNHFLDVFGRRILAQVPVLALGLSQEAIFIVAIFNTLQGYFVHANIEVSLGFLNYLVVSPEQHRLHHSNSLKEAGHYSVDISLWDLLFGTFTWQPGKKPTGIGVVEPDKFYSPDKIILSHLAPFGGRFKKKNVRKAYYPPHI